MTVLAARVRHFAGGDDRFAGERDDLAADRAVGVVRLNEIEVVRGDAEGEFVGGEEEAFAFGRGEAEVLFGLREGADALTQLPAPVVPFGFGRIGPVTGSVGAEVAQGGGANRFVSGVGNAIGGSGSRCHGWDASGPIWGRGVGRVGHGENGGIFLTTQALTRSICAPTSLSLSSMCS